MEKFDAFIDKNMVHAFSECIHGEQPAVRRKRDEIDDLRNARFLKEGLFL
jgi:hypothetical protein